MKLASLVAVFALAGFMASAVPAASDTDAPKSTVPALNPDRTSTSARRQPVSETGQHPVPIDVRVVLKSDPKKRVAAQVLCLPLEAMQPDFVFIRDESHEDREILTTHGLPDARPCRDERRTAGGHRPDYARRYSGRDSRRSDGHASRPAIDQSTGQPIVNQRINYGVKVIFPPRGFSLWGFGNGALTDNQGRFTLPGLVPRWKFDLTTWTKPENGPAKSWSLGAVTPRYSGIIDLGDIKLGALGRTTAAGPAQAATRADLQSPRRGAGGTC